MQTATQAATEATAARPAYKLVRSERRIHVLNADNGHEVVSYAVTKSGKLHGSYKCTSARDGECLGAVRVSPYCGTPVCAGHSMTAEVAQ
jgi:hypothetical protein